MRKFAICSGAFAFLVSILIVPSAVFASTKTAKSYARVNRYSVSQPVGYNPAQIRHAYGFDQISATGAGKLIAIVDAYHSSSIATSLAQFSATYNLNQLNGTNGKPSCSISAGPHPCFEVVYADGKKPAANSGWTIESTLDVEWAHAVAQKADILLVEAHSSSLDNLLSAVDVASARYPSAVSMSWGGSEFSTESQQGSHFPNGATRYVAASGDDGSGVSFPAVAANVIGVGGTSITLSNSGTRLSAETAWSGSGGGISKYIAQPSFQKSILSSGKRSDPDVSYAADPNHGFSVYLSGSGWAEVGGTSAGAPQWAAALTLAPSLNLPGLYGHQSNFTDILSGSNGSCGTICKAHSGYDYITGLGVPSATLFR